MSARYVSRHYSGNITGMVQCSRKGKNLLKQSVTEGVTLKPNVKLEINWEQALKTQAFVFINVYLILLTLFANGK